MSNTNANEKEESTIERKYDVRIMKPEGTTPPSGITVFLPGTIQKLDGYKTTYEAILKQNQIVLGVTSMNPFPVVGRSHDKMAED